MAKTPAPANVLRELAPPVEVAAVVEADSEAEDSELEDSLAVEVDVPVEVKVVIDPPEDIVEVIVEAAADAGQRTIRNQRGFQTYLKPLQR